MPLAAGARLGPFEIVSLAGTGAMGEVYRARDRRLDREVAIKILNSALASDQRAMARFEHEARAVAAINHPNIVALYDVGREGTTAYVVTEFVDGGTLRDRLQQGGALPVRKAIEYAQQMASAVAQAHDRGVVHRDLKPENILIARDGRLKIVDFGVAHIVPAASADSQTLAGTLAGAVVGTVGYMSPEQARAQAVDHRTDVFAIGAIVYELLGGRRAFDGATPADTFVALLQHEPPPLRRLSPGVPPRLERIVQRCLEKAPEARFQSARDLAFAFDLAIDDGDVPASGPMPPRRWMRLAVPLLTVALVAAIALAVYGWQTRSRMGAPAAPALPIRFAFTASTTWSDAASISPDGMSIVYTGAALGPSSTPSSGAVPGGRPSGFASISGRFWLRRLDALEAKGLSDTEAAYPLFFWSPDSRFLGYRVGNSIVVRELPDGAPRVLADLPSAPQAIAWGKADDLLVAMAGGLYRVSANGGAPQLVMKTEPGREIWRGSPSFLPDGQRFLYTALTSGGSAQALETRVGALDGRDLGVVARGAVGARYADGYLVFGSGGDLQAQRFDVERLALSGERVLLAAGVTQDWRTGQVGMGVSDNGVLVFRSAPRGDEQFTLLDRTGRVIRTIGAPDSYTNFSLAPDESRIIAARRDPLSGRVSLWLIDANRGVTSLATPPSDPEDADDPTWAPDGQHIAYRHGARVVLRLANGGPERVLIDSEGYPDAFTRDGRTIVYGQARGNVYEQFALEFEKPGAQPTPLITGITLADEARVSPDGRWLAYHSNETGTAQVYVTSFPPTGQRWQLSQSGGVQPRWSIDGRELFYLDPDGRLMSVRMPAGDPRQAAAPAALFRTGLTPSDALDHYTPTRSGFLLRMPITGASDGAAVQVIANWRTLVAR